MRSCLLSFLLLFSPLAIAGKYPRSWWAPVARDGAPKWEILPQDAKKGEVILSKRTELGVFSNLAHTPFNLDGDHYESIEGLWQMMKYPVESDPKDPRHKIKGWEYTREEVKNLFGFESKHAGSHANDLLDEAGIDWVDYQGHRFDYVDYAEGSAFHYELIYRAISAKIEQNPKLKRLLIKTKGLKLTPDHHQGRNPPASFKYNEILMKIRTKL